MAALRPAQFVPRSGQEGDSPASPTSRDRAPENWSRTQQEYSRKRPLYPEGEERLNSQDEGMQRRIPNHMRHYGPEGHRASGPPQRSAERRIQNDMSQRQPGERQRPGVIQPERRCDDSRPGNDTRCPSWGRRMENDNERQRLDLGEGKRSNVWRPDVRPHVNRSQSYQRQDSSERPIPPDPHNDNWRNEMSHQSPRNGQRKEDARGSRESGLQSGVSVNPSGFSIPDASRDYNRSDSGHSMPSPSPRVTWNESLGSRSSFDSTMAGCERLGSNNQLRSPSSRYSFDDNLGRPGFQGWGSNNQSRSPSSTPSDGWYGPHSPARRERPGWSNNDCNNFQGEPKRPRIAGPQQQNQRWQSNQLARGQGNRESNTQRDNSSMRKAPTHDSKSFAGRFVPRAEAADQYEKQVKDKPSNQVRANARVIETGDREGNVAHHGVTLDAKQGNGAPTGDKGVELQQMQHRIAHAKSEVVENQEKLTMVMKLPASLEVKRNSLKDIINDTFTPELTEASVETNLIASASYSSYSLSNAHSVIAIASPHSLTHPEDERMETETYIQGKLDAGWKVTPEDARLKETTVSVTVTEDREDAAAKDAPFSADVRRIFAGDQDSAAPVPTHWVRRSTRQQRSARSGSEDVPTSVTVTVDTEDITAKEADGQDSAVPVPTHWVRRSVRQPSRSVLSDGEHVGSRQKPFASSTALSDSDPSDSSGDETDEEELLLWAQKMLGVPPPVAVAQLQISTGDADALIDSSDEESERELESGKEKSLPRPTLTLHLKMGSTKKPSKASRQRKPTSPRRKGKVCRNKASKTSEQKKAEEAQVLEEAKRKKELAKPLTAADVRRILAEDEESAAPATHWVRRSDRQPSRSALNHPSVRSLLGKLRDNDYDMTVLKMKKYLSDPDTPQMIIDVALDALEENTNCQALYIQNFNQGMRDEQVLHLLKILQMPSCNIWCLNIGETYNVKTRNWELFAKGLKKTKITHMYASEHTITSALKEEIRETIRKNRSKHDMHISPDNLDVIVQCTHCWWNPVNAKVLRPYLSKRGLDYILHDKEAQGLQGSMSAALAGDAGKV